MRSQTSSYSFLGRFTEGRFTEERKAILNLIRDQLRKRHRGYATVLFDFRAPSNQDLTGTIETLGRLARFIIVDLTDPSSVPHELAMLIPFLRTTPIVPLRLLGSPEYAMFKDLLSYPWVLKVHEYADAQDLEASIAGILSTAEHAVAERRG
jgi:hypothetical protein